MSSFKKKTFTEPVICNHQNDVTKDWYVFFRFKLDGKILKFKRREGVNRIKVLEPRLTAIEELCEEIRFDLKHGWNPVLDRKREKNYSPYYQKRLVPKKLAAYQRFFQRPPRDNKSEQNPEQKR